MKFNLLLFCALISRAACDDALTPWEFFVKGITYLSEAFVQDLMTPMTEAPMDAYRTIPEMVMAAGYKLEIHKIKTKDDYINTAWRISGRLDEEISQPDRKPPVILQHGLMDDSASWLNSNASDALPYMLVDQGYDVWMVNSRGNIYSYEHVHSEIYDVKKRDSPYFNFTWDDMAQYDVPANIDYVLAHSDYPKVFYAGVSQGTTTFFAACDVVPNLKDKIAGFIAYSPIMYLGNVTNPFVWVQIKMPVVYTLQSTHQYNFFLVPEESSWMLRLLGIKFKNTFARLLQLLCGITEEIHMDVSRMSVFLHHQPGGTSLFNMKHWSQAVTSGNFQKYDYGNELENLKHYGTKTPSLYDTSKITKTLAEIPSMMFWGERDALAVPKDFAKLEKLLEGTNTEVIKLKDYNHADTISASDCKQRVLEPSIEFIKKHMQVFESE